MLRKDNSCQPNFRRDVAPDPGMHCGPYAPASVPAAQPLPRSAALPASQAAASAVSHAQAAATQLDTHAARQGQPELIAPYRHHHHRHRMHASADGGRAGLDGLGPRSHDTIAMMAVDAAGRFAAGASTNGMTHKARHTHILQCLCEEICALSIIISGAKWLRALASKAVARVTDVAACKRNHGQLLLESTSMPLARMAAGAWAGERCGGGRRRGVRGQRGGRVRGHRGRRRAPALPALLPGAPAGRN